MLTVLLVRCTDEDQDQAEEDGGDPQRSRCSVLADEYYQDDDGGDEEEDAEDKLC